METNIILTTLEECVIDALHQTSICSSDFEWINDDERRFVNFSDASNWAIKNGLTTIASDEQIITTIFSLIERGLVKQTDSRSNSSVWFSVTAEGAAQL